jgi:hypothetical protein
MADEDEDGAFANCAGVISSGSDEGVAISGPGGGAIRN